MSNSVRNLGIVAWKDPLAWTESMKGERWKNLIASEKNNYEKISKKYISAKDVQAIQDELAYASEVEHARWISIGKYIQVQMVRSLSVSWKWNGMMGEPHSSADIAIDDKGNVWEVVDIGDGSEKYAIRFWKYSADTYEWQIENVAPFVLKIEKKLYFLTAANSLWYNSLMSVTANSGKAPEILYQENDPQWNLSLVRGENHTGYLVRENSGLQEAFFIAENCFRKLLQKGFFVLGGGAPNDYFFTEGRGTDNWKSTSPRLQRWKLPNDHGIPESVSPHFGLLVTRKQGERYLWKCSAIHEPKLLYYGICNIFIDTFRLFYREKSVQIFVMKPGAFISTYEYEKDLIEYPSLGKPYAEIKRHYVNHVPYISVKNPSLPAKALLVVGYGAYGMSTLFTTTRWYPLLLRGWIVVFALVRGGGDDTMAWADAARTWRREFSIEDFEAVIGDSRKRFNISSENTCIYGRSAGGILIGAAAARQKNTKLFGGLYGEVPYLDVLRTTTNPMLPLTKLEYDEFGNPNQRLEDLVAVAKISPIDGIPEEGYPNLFALIRTGENDKEVFAYEPVKWILKSRGKNKNDTSKILAFEENEGHFVGGSSGMKNRVADLAFLLAWQRGASFKI